MKNTFTLSIIASTIFLLSSTSASADLAIIESASWNDSTYHIIESANWYESEQAAQSLGGHLVTINTQDENDFIYDLWGLYGTSEIITKNHLWIGLSDEYSEGDFTWSSGESFSFSNFKPGEPNGSTRENHVYMWTRGESVGTWNDIPGLLGANYQDGIYGVVEVKNITSGGELSAIQVASPFAFSSFFFLWALFRRSFKP